MLHAPGPAAIVTIGSKTGSSRDCGEDGINIGAADNLNVTISKNTKMHSGENRFVQTAQTVTEVAGGDMALSSSGNYKLRTNANVELTAGGSGPDVTPWQVLDGATNADFGTPHNAILSKVKDERTTVEGIGKTLSVVFSAFKFVSVGLKAKSVWDKGLGAFGSPDAKGLWSKASAGLEMAKAAMDAAEAGF